MRMLRVSLLGIASLALASSLSAQQILLPNAGYLAATTKFGIPAGPSTSLTSGALTLTFSEEGEYAFAPGGGWATWSEAPESERQANETLDLLTFGSSAGFSMSLSHGVSIFGFEAEPDAFDVFDFTATFFSGATQLGSFTRSVNGDAGARLFAFAGTNIDRVTFTTVSGEAFAAGAFRFAESTSVVPEPSTYALMAAGLLMLVVVGRRRRLI